MSHQQTLDANAGTDLEGLPGPVNVPGTGPLHFHGHRDIQRLANEYNAKNGLGRHPQQYHIVDPAKAAQVAQAYDQLEHNPNDPHVKAAYDALKSEVAAQYQHAKDNGYKFEFYPQGRDPYPNSPREAVLDLHHNKHMYVYPTAAGYGMDENPTDHPMLEDSGETWNGQPVTYNDQFRAIHDFYGHAKEGLGFRANGEDNAYRQHAAMFSPLAQQALATETRGQNSWVNYGPYGAQNQTAGQADTVFAPQKAGLMPQWATDPNLYQQPPQDAQQTVTAADEWTQGDMAGPLGQNYAGWIPTNYFTPDIDRTADPQSADKVERVKQSLLQRGFLDPLWVDYHPDTKMAYLSEGNHRAAAAAAAGIPSMPVIVNRSMRNPSSPDKLRGPHPYVGNEADVRTGDPPQYIHPRDIGLPEAEPWAPSPSTPYEAGIHDQDWIKVSVEMPWGQDWDEWNATKPDYKSPGHQLGYDPTKHAEGKGFILQNGSVWTWPTQDLRPMHMNYSQYAKRLGEPVVPGSAFHIQRHPNMGNRATVWQYGEGRNLDPVQQQQIANADPRIYPYAPDAAPQVQPDQYGHADALVKAVASFCKVCRGRPYVACPGCVK
jgi:hypothetical protein